MADQKDGIILSGKLNLDPQAAIKATERFQKEMTKRLKMVEKNEERVNKGIGRLITKLGGARRTWTPFLREQAALYEDITKKIRDQHDTLVEMEADALKLSGEAQSKKLKDIKEYKSELDKLRVKEEDLREMKATIESQLSIDPKELASSMKEAGSFMAKPFTALIAKDIPGAFEAGGEIAGHLIEGAFKVLPKTLGRKVSMGASEAAAGKGLKEISGMAGKFGAVLNTLSKIGPMLGAASSLMVGLVKMFIDAEAAAKGFNKEILSTSGSSSFLHGNIKNVDQAARGLELRLRSMYTAATDLDNIKWGITKETHAAVVGALSAEGVELKKLGDRFDEVGKGALQTKGYVKDFGTMTQMSVAYSRAFGVSLSEITQLQGEMMTELGMDLDSVQSQFQFMLKGANEAGIATNKFFGIIRSFSSDLSLFTLRMEDVTQVMMALGKSMNPRDAQKFLQMVTQQFKGMDLMGRTRATMIAGKGTSRDVLQSGLERRLAALGQDIQNSVGKKGIGRDIAALVKAGDQNKIAQFMAEHQERMTAEQKSAIWDAARMQAKLASGNTIDLASAMKDASPMDVVDLMEAQSRKLFQRPLEKLNGTQLLAAGQALNIGDEQIDQIVKMKMGIMQVQQDMIHKLGQGQEGLQRLTQAERDALVKLGIDADASNAASLLAEKDAAAVFDSLAMDQKRELQNGKVEIDYQKKTSSFQTDLMTKVEALSEWFMGTFYNLIMRLYEGFMGLWDDLKGLPGIGGASKSEKFASTLTKTGDQKLIDILNKSDGSLSKWKSDSIKKIFGPEFAKSFGALGQKDQHAKLKSLKGSLSGSQKDAYDADVKRSGGRDNLSLEQQARKILYYMDPEKLLSEFGRGAKPGPAGTMSAAPVEVEDGPTEAQQEETTHAVSKVSKTIQKGIPLNQKTVQDVGGSTLDAIRKGLFEYYLYSGLDRSSVALGLKNGMDPLALASGITSRVAETASLDAAYMSLQPNAAGGVVSGIAGDLAQVRRFPPAPPGEGWASVGQGEKIIPAGGRGGGQSVKVELELKDDLKRFVKANVVNGVAEFERNKRLR